MSEAANLNELQRDVLREVGNIGAGHSATALSQLLDARVDLSQPALEIIKFSELPKRLKYGTRAVAALHMGVKGKAPADIIVLFDREQAAAFVDGFIRRLVGDIRMFDSIKDSTLMELGNIIAGAYVTAIIDLTGVDLVLSVPTLAYGTIDGALRKLMNNEAAQDVFMIENSFLMNNDKQVSGQFLLIPEKGSLEPFFSAFGV
ncbi:MAG: chemotaxis protein CheC [Candidatus Eremiobacteraeota bacterium]|nr:chemotaxis protein CheC [Candidatus Eremiobacteraeota bacterium]